ncbi:hypothetical protein N0V82_004560 [Gnomoniopsis sp. IMI 355080]|nr:hypothetical protein N0V82_004560 [Gnomoniopsis sp. IMI 355080]
MLDENLPSFTFKQSQNNPLQSPVYFTQHGSEPAPEFIFERAHPSTNPAAAKKYAVALKDPYHQDVVYAEVVVSPEWSQPTLSAAEVRTQQAQNNGARLQIQPTPLIPDSFTIQLYDPDQTVTVRYIPSSLTKTDSFEFEMLSQSFKMPTPSQLDRQTNEPRADFRPRIMFKWKRDSRLSKDMTCYNVGKSLGKHKSKEPDITVALFKMSRETEITVYEPNLQRVEMEDRKGLDIVLVLGAEVIRDLYLAPEKRPDLFNIGGAGPVGVANGRRKNSRPSPPPPAALPAPRPGANARPPTNGPSMAMSGALGAAPLATSTANVASTYNKRPGASAVDAETERLRRMVDEEERRARKEAAEREKRDREEAKRIEKMLKQEEDEKRKRQAQVDQETERLKQLYGTQGQELPSNRPRHNTSPRLPPRHVQFQGVYPSPPQQQAPHFAGPPQRPSSVGPGSMGPFNYSSMSNFFGRSSAPPPPPQQQPSGQARPNGRPQQGPYQSGNPMAAVSGFFQNVLDPKKKPITKKRSMQW